MEGSTEVSADGSAEGFTEVSAGAEVSGAGAAVVVVSGRPLYCARLLAWMSTCASSGCGVFAILPRLVPSFIRAPSQECAMPMAWPSSWVMVITRLSV